MHQLGGAEGLNWGPPGGGGLCSANPVVISSFPGTQFLKLPHGLQHSSTASPPPSSYLQTPREKKVSELLLSWSTNLRITFKNLSIPRRARLAGPQNVGLLESECGQQWINPEIISIENVSRVHSGITYWKLTMTCAPWKRCIAQSVREVSLCGSVAKVVFVMNQQNLFKCFSFSFSVK